MERRQEPDLDPNDDRAPSSAGNVSDTILVDICDLPPRLSALPGEAAALSGLLGDELAALLMRR